MRWQCWPTTDIEKATQNTEADRVKHTASRGLGVQQGTRALGWKDRDEDLDEIDGWVSMQPERPQHRMKVKLGEAVTIGYVLHSCDFHATRGTFESSQKRASSGVFRLRRDSSKHGRHEQVDRGESERS